MKSWVGAVAFLLGCPLTKSQAPSSNIRGCIEPSSFDPSIDYFPDKSVVGYSKNWNVTYHSYYKVLTVTDTPSWSGATTTVYTYVLYQCGAGIPSDPNLPDDAQYISVPITSFALTQSSEIPHIELLGLRANTTAYAADDQYIESSCVRALIDDGSIELFDNSTEFLSTYPDGLSFAGGWDSDKTEARRVVILEGDEKSNLAIFEWHKLYGTFFNAEADANDIFDDTRERYDCATAKATTLSSEQQTETIVWAYYSEYGGGWDVADCPNYYCEYSEHCGAMFLNSSDGSIFDDYGGVYMNDIEFEAHAKDADAWVYAGFNFETIYSKNKAMLDGFVSIQNKRVFDYSSNAWFEQRYAEPDAVLQDFCDVLEVSDENYQRKWFRNVFNEGSYYSEQCTDVNAPLVSKASACSNPTPAPTPAPASTSTSSSRGSMKVAWFLTACVLTALFLV